MLDELVVTNLGVIDSARINPGPGMVVMSGETGTGKTMLLGALRLLTGETASAELVGPNGSETAAQGRFLIGSEEMVISRKITRSDGSPTPGQPAGRSRAYIDDQMVSAKRLAQQLQDHFEIVGRQDHLALSRISELRSLLDRRLPSAEPVADYRAAWDRVNELRSAQEQLGGDRRGLEREMEMLTYQTEEINQAAFTEGEDQLLHSQVARLRNAQTLNEILHQVRAGLDQARDLLGESVESLREGARLDPGFTPLLTQVEGVSAEVADSLDTTRVAGEELVPDPEKLEQIDERLRLLGDLRRKYGETISEIIQFRDQAALRCRELGELLENADTVATQLAIAIQELEKSGRDLREARSQAAQQIRDEAVAHLSELGFVQPVLHINVEAAQPGPGGADQVEVLFASDPRLVPAPAKRAASGGELSRLILSLRLASGAGSARIVAFDEIDAGVGGTTALAMGAKLAELANDRQVFCVTHLPQVAAFADSHFVVERSGAQAQVRQVEGTERLKELTRMLSGLSDSARGHEHAEELLAIAGGRRDRPAS